MGRINRGLALGVAMVGTMAMGGELKTGPRGIYALLPSYNSERPVELAGPVWGNPLVKGVTVRTVWRNVEPEEGKRDWPYFDEAAGLAAKNGKKVGLSMAAGIFTPEWVYKDGAERFGFTQMGPWIPTRAMTMPEPWDEGFLAKWGATVRAMGARYDGNPAVAYVMIGGVGFSIESVFVKTPEDVAKLKGMGGTERWLEGAEKVVDIYAGAFPTTPFIYAMAPPVKGDFSATRALVEYGETKYPGRFGIMHHGLNAQAAPDFYPDAAVTRYTGRGPAGFQMVWSAKGDEGAKRVKGTLGEALAKGREFGGQWVEVYEEDCEDAGEAGALGWVDAR